MPDDNEEDFASPVVVERENVVQEPRTLEKFETTAQPQGVPFMIAQTTSNCSSPLGTGIKVVTASILAQLVPIGMVSAQIQRIPQLAFLGDIPVRALLTLVIYIVLSKLLGGLL